MFYFQCVDIIIIITIIQHIKFYYDRHIDGIESIAFNVRVYMSHAYKTMTVTVFVGKHFPSLPLFLPLNLSILAKGKHNGDNVYIPH